MGGADGTTGALFSYVDLEARVPARHPLRVIRTVVNEVLAGLDAEFTRMYAALGRPSIAPEKLLRGSLLQAFYTIRSERQLMEQLDYNRSIAGSWGSASTIRCGTIRPTRRTAIGSWKPILPGSS